VPPTDRFDLIATVIFALAVAHTFFASRFAAAAQRIQHQEDAASAAAGRVPAPSFAAEVLHFFGEVEVVFGLWAVPLLVTMGLMRGWHESTHYVNDTVNYTEPLFVVVIMAMASARPVVTLAENLLRKVAALGRGTPAAWWITILILGPLMGSLITEPAAMTICALLLARQFYDLEPSPRLKYGTLGLLFVNVSIGGTLTHFAAPPVLMVARHWGWDTPFMLGHFGGRAFAAIVASTILYYLVFLKEFRLLGQQAPVPDIMRPAEEGLEPPVRPIPMAVTFTHLLFLGWTVLTAHYPALFLAGFMFFLGFTKATAPSQSELDLKTPLLVGFFLAGLVIHGGLQGWWIAPLLARLDENPLFWGATLLTAFNDNALITYLATLVPDLSEPLKAAVVEGAVTGGGLTVIANAPNPAGQALLGRFFNYAISPIYLLAGAIVPTLIAAAMFRLF
jgi:hypothetical protein